MSQITLIEQQKKDKNRCNIYIDGRFYCGIKMEVAIKYHLKSGMDIEKSRLDEIQLETEKSQALDRAMTHISATMKTQKQVNDFLEKKGYTQLVIDYCIGKMKEYKFIDDAAYCQAYISCVTNKGRRAIYSDLMRRGVPKELIERSLAEFEEDDEALSRVLEKYLRNKPKDSKNMSRAFKYLLSKGYDYENVKNAIEGFEIEDN